MKALAQQILDRFDKIEEQFDKMEDPFDKIEARMSDLVTTIGNFNPGKPSTTIKNKIEGICDELENVVGGDESLTDQVVVEEESKSETHQVFDERS